MANERLRDAIMKSGKTPAMIAGDLQVDAKTVERWITKGRTPYQRHRARIAALLGASENYLWPDALSEDRKTLASQSEVVTMYPRRTSVPPALWLDLLDRAERFIGVLAYAGLFLPEQDPAMIETLRRKAEAGAEVVILLGYPDSPAVALRGADEGIGDAMAAKVRNVLSFYQQLRGVPNIKVMFHDTTLYNSIYWYDDQMLVNTHAFGFPAAHAPVMHLRQLSGGTLFDTYSQSFDRVRSRSASVWMDEERDTVTVWHG
ncbi:helix-turn-helix transcriptional regulator [Longispora albida]|uniref:helix-turn-helix transcriptional regulator n=1 Tax=Longispora albida TaxID=203523 RepID=UPI0003694CBB|nr:helix-turn-helix transcriptional regulator [Longispora albida]